MAIPLTGPISLQQIAAEFGGSAPHSLSEYYRGGPYVVDAPINAGVPTSGPISLNNFRGASGRITVNVTISSSTTNYDVYANRSGAYVAGVTDLVVTIAPGVTVYSGSSGSSSMYVSSAFASTDTVTIVNNGAIVGAGGAGGAGGTGASSSPQPGNAGGAGGTALYVERAVFVTNNGTIAGGGGGGGGGGASYYSGKEDDAKGGAGGGGGAGQVAGGGGAGGAAFGQELNQPGTAGTSGTATTGGVTGRPGGGTGGNRAGFGGSGGGLGSAGAAGQKGNSSINANGGAGGAAGYYIVGNSNVTWTVFGTCLGQAA